jgi:hypothetical protein
MLGLDPFLLICINDDCCREQRAAQEGDTAAARKMLAQAAVDMEGVQAELRGRRQQWQSSLLGLQRRDDALKVLISPCIVLDYLRVQKYRAGFEP